MICKILTFENLLISYLIVTIEVPPIARDPDEDFGSSLKELLAFNLVRAGGCWEDS
jgi:hypothetical protein